MLRYGWRRLGPSTPVIDRWTFGAGWRDYLFCLSEPATEVNPMGDELSHSERWLIGELFELSAKR